MPRIIFTSRYLSQAPITQLANLVEYMGTRPGVELCPAGWPELPATEKQQALITRLRGELPDVTTLPEYAKYQHQPNREGARIHQHRHGTVCRSNRRQGRVCPVYGDAARRGKAGGAWLVFPDR